MVAADIDEGAGEGWGEDAALVIDEGTRKSHFRKGFLLTIPIHFPLFYNKQSTFTTFLFSEQTQCKKVKAWLDNFLQIIVFCQPKLESVPLFRGMWEGSLQGVIWKNLLSFF